MFSNRLAFAALAVGCLAAAAGGGYLATRQNTVPTPASAAASSTAPDTASHTVPAAVQETEAVVGDPHPAPAPPPEPGAPSKPRTEAAPRGTVLATARSGPRRRLSSRRADRTWPSGASAQPPQNPPAPLAPSLPPPMPDERAAQELPRAPEPPQRIFDELVVPAESVIGLQTETALSSDRARVEDRVEAHVTRDVRVNGQVAIPAGAKALGSVTQVDRGGKFKERARIAVRFHTLVLADGTRLPMNTESIVREGAEPDAAKKVGGGAVGGAILGAILGGAKGAAIGAAAGAGGGAAVQMAGDPYL